MPVTIIVSIPLGLMIWVLGLLYNLSVMQRHRRGSATHSTAQARRSYQRITARTIMNLGVAIGSRSWLTLIAAAVLIPLYAAAARRRQRYLDYMRTGVMSDAFPDRIVRH